MSERRQTFVIKGRLPSLNEYINAERTNRYIAASMKKKAERRIRSEIKRCGIRPVLAYPVTLIYHFYCPDRRTDKGNVSATGQKLIEDSLQGAGIIRNDGWSELNDPDIHFDVDKENTRIEVTIVEEGN
jgi:hypothetical protein